MSTVVQHWLRAVCLSLALAGFTAAGAAAAFADPRDPTPAAIDDRSPAVASIPAAMPPADPDSSTRAAAARTLPMEATATLATLPPPRVHAPAIVDPVHNRLVVFGGWYNTAVVIGPALNDVWTLELAGAPIWTPLAPAADPYAGVPSPRYGHNAVYDPLRHRMLVFGGTNGGLNGTGTFNEVWALDLNGAPAWSKLAPQGTPPTARFYASAVYDPVRDRMIVFGGTSEPYLVDNEVWALSLSGTPTWSILGTPGERPSLRMYQSMIYDPVRDRMVMCGGDYGDADVWVLPLAGGSWAHLATAGAGPLPRARHTAVYDAGGDRMILFGGSVSGVNRNDTWALSLGNTPTWSALASSTPPPAARSEHAAAYDGARQRMVVAFGRAMNDAWSLPLQGATDWSEIHPIDGPAPTVPVPTFADSITGLPASIHIGQSFTIHATVRNDGTASDDGRIVLAFPALTDPSDGTLVSSSSRGDTPGFRVAPAGSGIQDAGCGPVTASYLVAEYADDAWAEFGAETHQFDLRVTPSAAGTFYVDVRSTMRIAGSGCAAQNGLPVDGEAGQVDQQGWAVKRFAVTVLPLPSEPVRRRLHSAVYDPVRKRMLVFGGWVGAPSDEVWALSLDGTPTWSLVLADPGPSPRFGHAAIYDPVRDRMIVFGGYDVARRNDVWALTLSGTAVWTRLDPVPGPQPAPRRYHSAIYDPRRDQMVIFGGSSDFGDMNEVWAFDLAAQRWVNHDQYPRPAWRKQHAAVYDPVRDQMLVFGGLLGTGTRYDELWALSLTDWSWSRIAPIGDRPSARSGHTLTYDPARDRLWLVGGNSGTFENDVWTFAPATQNWERVGTWGTPMGVREMHATVADSTGDRLVVYGGTDSLGRVGDTWFLTRGAPATWQKRGGPAPPPPPTDPAPVFPGPIAGLPATVTIGQTFQVRVAVRNDGAPSDDGRIAISFPEMIGTGDAQWVSAARAGDSPGVLLSPAGSTVRSAGCQPLTAPCLIAEYADSSWQGFGAESDTLTLTIQPRAVGPFHLDVRATMHRPGDPGCAALNAVPADGEGGHVDPQGWPAARFTVDVLAPLTDAKPVFPNGAYPGPGRITLGQTITLYLDVQNDGPSSDDGRIVAAFPAFDAVADSANVTAERADWQPVDAPGFRKLPAGSILSDSTCAPVTSTYLTVEYADNDWLAAGAEHNYIRLTIKPRAAGTFYVDVRSTMRTAGKGACAYANGLPANGSVRVTDPQGWTVKRYAVTVDPPPATALPQFTNLQISPITLIQSQRFDLWVNVTDLGLASDDGHIVVGFPTLTDPADGDRVTVSNDNTLIRKILPGWVVDDSLCQPHTTGYVMVDLTDTAWPWLGSRENGFSLSVVPPDTGAFYIDVRSTMRTAGAGPCAYVNGIPASGDTVVVDPFGWRVRRFTVRVNQKPPPRPSLDGPYVGPPNLPLGQPFTLNATLTNQSWPSDDGRMCISFPSLTLPGDSALVSLAPIYGNPPTYREHPAGETLERADCQPVTASCLMVEVTDTLWTMQKSQTLTLQVTPRDTGLFVIQCRGTMHWTVGAPCDFVNDPSASSATDQQGWPVRTVTVRVTPPPPTAPTFVDIVSIPSAIALGETFLITATVRNDGATSGDGRISLAFPSLTDPGDAPWVSSAATGDAPGFVEYPAGSTLTTFTCGTVTSTDLVAEYVDDDWRIGEVNTVLVTVQPRVQGTFLVDVRATMRDTSLLATPCRYANAMPVNGTAGPIDAQGWAVRRFAVQVGPPLGPPSVRWTPIAALGSAPAARALQAAVYDVSRDEFALYGGTAAHYTGDSWTLPLPDHSSWASLQPGGPVPLRRIQHSMIYDPVNTSFMIFGGQYDDVLDDLWVLARAPVTWWFPITPPGARPSARMGHAAVYDPVRQRMLVIGGYGRELLNDVWEYSPMVNGTWHLLTPAGTPMPARATFSAVYDPPRDRIVIFGGDGGAVLNDVWELRLAPTPAWNPLSPDGIPPAPRREQTAVYDPQWDEMVVFGGFDGARRLNDVWTLGLSGTLRWERRLPEDLAPAPRSGHSAVYDPVRQRVVVFGGQLTPTDYSNEVWELKVERATPVVLSLAAVDVQPDRVKLSWFGEQAAAVSARVERRTGQDAWIALGAPDPDGSDRLVFVDRDVSEGVRYGYRLVVSQEGREEALPAVWVTVPTRAVLSLAGASPNPVSGAFVVGFSLPGGGAGALELFDLHGRLVARRDLAGMTAGPHRVSLADGRHLAAGVYLLRLAYGDTVLRAKACVVR